MTEPTTITLAGHCQQARFEHRPSRHQDGFLKRHSTARRAVLLFTTTGPEYSSGLLLENAARTIWRPSERRHLGTDMAKLGTPARIVDDFEALLNLSFEDTPRAPVEQYLGMHVTRNRERRLLAIDGRRHVRDFIHDMGYDHKATTTVCTPLDPSSTARRTVPQKSTPRCARKSGPRTAS